jgi:hypothetical protein
MKIVILTYRLREFNGEGQCLGGGKGISDAYREERRIWTITRKALNAFHLLELLRFVRQRVSLWKHNRQAKEYRHNLFVVLRASKG